MNASLFIRRALPTAREFSTSASGKSFAKLTVLGRLASQPELQATSTGNEILKYAVATSTGPKDKQKTSFFRVTSFLPEGPQRDFIASLEKGTLVYVEGEASIGEYDDKDGNRRSVLNVIQQRIEVLSPKKSSSEE